MSITIPSVPRIPYTAEQDSALRTGWESGVSPAEIMAQVNALLGRDMLNVNHLYSRVAILGLKRPDWYVATRTRGPQKKPAPRVRVSVNGPKPIGVPLREVYRWGAEFNVPLALRGDVEAVSRAARLADPSHPGFVVRSPVPPGFHLTGYEG